MKSKIFKFFSLVAFVTFTSCGESTDTVESGTYEGTVKKVEASKTEIYVETADNKTRIVLYGANLTNQKWR